MQDFVFELKIKGTMTIQANSLEEAQTEFIGLDNGDILYELDSSSSISGNCVGTYNEDGSIEYFEEGDRYR